jgi:hypothetical protein
MGSRALEEIVHECSVVVVELGSVQARFGGETDHAEPPGAALWCPGEEPLGGCLDAAGFAGSLRI